MEEEIVKLIAEVLEVGIDDIDGELAIGDLPEWDSLHHLKIISTIESKYSIKFTSDELKELEDVSDIISLITNLKV